MSNFYNQASWVLVPSGIEEDIVFAQKPTSGLGDLTFTRSSDATYTDSTGVVRRSPYNLLTFSEMFSDASWNKVTTTVTPNTTIAPNGTLTADSVTILDSNSRIAQTTTLGAGTYTISVYVKLVSTTTEGIVRINSTVDGASTNSFFTPTTEWARYTTTVTATTGVTSIALRGTLPGFVGTLAVWGFQVVQGTSALDYFPTTNRQDVPRIDFRNADGTLSSCGRLLLEPQRTNLSLYSEQFDNATWTKTRTTVTANTTATLDPFGMNSADKLIPSVDNNTHFIQQAGITVTAQIYTATIFAKKAEYDTVRLLMANLWSVPNPSGIFNLTTGTITLAGATGTIQDYGNGWYKCSITATANAAAGSNAQLQIWAGNNGVTSFAGDGTSGVYITGAQFESGTYSTTYIPTTTAAVTRIADAFSRNNIFTNGFLSSAGGTWFIDLSHNLSLTRDGATSFSLGDNALGTLGNSINIRHNGATQRLSVNKAVSGTLTSLYTTLTDNVKIAVKWNGSTADVFVNGVKRVTATSFTATQLQFLAGTGGDIPKYINQMWLAPNPLSDAECIERTTL